MTETTQQEKTEPGAGRRIRRGQALRRNSRRGDLCSR